MWRPLELFELKEEFEFENLGGVACVFGLFGVI